MDKPTVKSEIGITFVSQALRRIHFYSTSDALPDIQEFGYVFPSGDGYPPQQKTLEVDPRFDFQEVISYLESYGK